MKLLKKLVLRLLKLIPIMRVIIEHNGQNQVTLRTWFIQKVLGFNRDAYWPVHFTSVVTNWRNIYAGVDTSPGCSPGCYIQGIGGIFIDDYSQVGINVGIISSNHDPYERLKHIHVGPVRIGKYCLISMNSMILPGVTLGDFTFVGAGAVVSRSFPEGYCVVAGNPAKVVRKLDPEKCHPFKNAIEYNGYIKAEKFEAFRAKNLTI